MAGKGTGRTRKKSTKPAMPALSVERFTYDTMSNILQLCGFPAEKIPVKESKMNEYSQPNYVTMVSSITLTIALGFRDTWKRMFESRFRSSGLDSNKKIEEYLGVLLSMNAEFKEGNRTTKIHVSLALYSEMMQFLNFKGEDVDLEQLFNSWSCFFKKNIAQNQCTDKLLQELFVDVIGAHDFLRDITDFVKENANPYGKMEEISEEFKRFTSEQETIERELKRHLEAANKNIIERVGFEPPNPQEDSPFSGAGISQAAFSQALKMGADLPGDRESPEPLQCPFYKETGDLSQISSCPYLKAMAAKSPSKPSTKAIGVSESLGGSQGSSSDVKVEDSLEKLKLGDETVSQKIQGAMPKRKPSRRRSAKAAGASKRTPEKTADHNIVGRLVSEHAAYEGSDVSSGILRLGTDLLGDRDSPDLTECSERCDVDESRKQSTGQSAEATGVLERQGVIPKRKPSSKKKCN